MKRTGYLSVMAVLMIIGCATLPNEEKVLRHYSVDIGGCSITDTPDGSPSPGSQYSYNYTSLSNISDIKKDDIRVDAMSYEDAAEKAVKIIQSKVRIYTLKNGLLEEPSRPGGYVSSALISIYELNKGERSKSPECNLLLSKGKITGRF